MAMTMTGRVLLVCALCVLWCGAGGVYARDVDTNALGGCMALGVLGENGSHMPDGCNKTAITVPLRSVLPITAVEASDGKGASVETKNRSNSSENSDAGASTGSADLAVDLVVMVVLEVLLLLLVLLVLLLLLVVLLLVLLFLVVEIL
ncbi:mucin-associated surface protein (MASP), partial [Trypanosoma cruzi]